MLKSCSAWTFRVGSHSDVVIKEKLHNSLKLLCNYEKYFV